MTAASYVLLALTILLSSFISGVFGMAGGMILLGVLLNYFDVAAAMILFSIIQFCANGWRAYQWRHYVRWPIFFKYVVGAVLAFAAMYSIKFVPNKMMVYLSLGLMPFAIEALPRDWRPNIEWRGVPFVTGVLTTIIQVLAGVGGLFLDIFFQKSMLDRKTTNATKATVQSLSHIVRIAYFGTVSGMANVPKWALPPAIALAIAATSLAPFVIERMTDHGFRQWTRASSSPSAWSIWSAPRWCGGTGNPSFQSISKPKADMADGGGSPRFRGDDYWLAHKIRATHSTSSVAMVRSGCWALSDFELDRFRRLALELLRHHLAVPGLDHDAVAAADRRGRRHHDHVAVAIGRLHRLAGHFERIGVGVVDRRKGDLVPAGAGREAAVVEIAAGAGLGEAEQRHAAGRRGRSLDQRPKASMLVPVATSALLIDSVDGQRARPAAVMRFDLLNVVGSRPARRARPEAESPARAARRSIADQTCACVSITTPYNPADDRNYCLDAQGPIGSRRIARVRDDDLSKSASGRRGARPKPPVRFADRMSINATASSISRPRPRSPRRRLSILPDSTA